MTKKPETLTCYQLWKRYHNADKRSTVLRREWKQTVDKLHDTMFRIDMVKETLRKETTKLPAKELGRPIPLDIQEKLFFLRHELAALRGLRKELHAINLMYKKQSEEATSRANRYKMAYTKLKPIACKQIPEGCENPGKFIDDFQCTVSTNKNGNLIITFTNNDGSVNKFKF